METDELPWCGTCGKTISFEEYLKNNGDCDVCDKWWKENLDDG